MRYDDDTRAFFVCAGCGECVEDRRAEFDLDPLCAECRDARDEAERAIEGRITGRTDALGGPATEPAETE